MYSFVKVAEDKKEWKEKGLGYLKLNVKRPATDGDEHETKRARFIMRADGSHRVVLNTPVQKELRVGNSKGDAPSGGYIYFWGSVDSKPQLELLQLKACTPRLISHNLHLC